MDAAVHAVGALSWFRSERKSRSGDRIGEPNALSLEMAKELLITGKTVALTQRAAKKIKEVMKEQGSLSSGLRIRAEWISDRVAYELLLQEGPSPADVTIEDMGVRLIIDPASAKILRGSEIDYVVTSRGAGFSIRNPNVSCGCGPGCGCQQH